MAQRPSFLNDRGPTPQWGLYYDPVYKYIPMRPVFRDALAIPLMQRLRRIRQLSTVELVFPGATHNRFGHSVGVYHLATLAFSVLQEQQFTEDPPGWPRLDRPGMLMALQFAALFHDVGHGPYSHIFEIFCTRTGHSELKHQKLTRRTIAGEISGRTQIAEFLAHVHDQSSHLNGAEFLKPKNVAAIATGEPPPDSPECVFLSEIVDSTFDVDRMDYLLRDSLHLGIDLGGDPWEVLHAYTLAEAEPEAEESERSEAENDAKERSTQDQPVWRLAVNVNAAIAAEGLLAARDHAYRRVYYHSTHRVDQEMLVLAMYEYSNGSPTEDMAFLTDDELLSEFEDCAAAFPQEVAKRIRDRQLYEPLPYEISVNLDLDHNSRRRWYLFNSKPEKEIYETVVKEAAASAEAAGFDKDRDRVIFDLEQTALSKEKDYSHPWLWDPDEEQRRSLLEVCPHLQMMHKVRKIAGRDQSLHEAYVAAASTLITSLPYASIRGRIRNKVIEARNTGEKPERESVARAVYEESIKPIVETLLKQILGFEEGDKKQDLEEKLTARALRLLCGLAAEEIG